MIAVEKKSRGRGDNQGVMFLHPDQVFPGREQHPKQGKLSNKLKSGHMGSDLRDHLPMECQAFHKGLNS